MENRKPEERKPAPHEQTEMDVEEEERPVPGVEHHREPDAENIMPAKDMPGTL